MSVDSDVVRHPADLPLRDLLLMSTTKNQLPNSVTENQPAASSWFAILAGLGLAAGFYIAVHFIRWAPLNRYFLGHPVAIAATILFCVAVSVLAFKWMRGHDQLSLIHI